MGFPDCLQLELGRGVGDVDYYVAFVVFELGRCLGTEW